MVKAVRIIWIDSDTEGVLGHKVYRDDIEIGDVGMGVQEFVDATAVQGITYKYEIQAYTLTAESIDEVESVNVEYYRIGIDYAIPTNISVVETEALKPIMTNFRILEANPDRVYFDTPLGPVTGIDLTGFAITSKTINAVDTVNNYFTVSAPFTFYDNHTIRLGETNDTSDHQTVLHNFTMRDIDNQMDEPATTVDRYVSASGSGDGSSEGNAASYSYACSNAVAGETWWIKAGTYTISESYIQNSGTLTEPIKFIGYKDTIGDIVGNYWNYGDAIDPSEMPYLTSGGTGFGAVSITDREYIFIRNMQATISGGAGFKVGGCRNIVLDNLVSKDNNNYNLVVWKANSNTIDSERVRITNVKGSGSSLYGLWMAGHHCKMDNSEAWGGPITQYTIQTEGNYNIVKNSSIAREVENPNHTGHGLNFNQINYSQTTYGLFVDCSVMNCDKSVEFRKGGTADCVARNITVWNNGGTGSEDTSGPSFRDGAKRCVFENGSIDVGAGSNGSAIWLTDSDEGGTGLVDNTVRNTLIKNSVNVILYDNKEANGSELNGFKFLNNTIYNCNRLIWETYNTFAQTNCEFKNNIVNSTTNFSSGGATFNGWTVDSNNWSDNGFSPEGTNQNTDDPNFVDTTDFVPQENSLIMGAVQFGVELDVNDNVRADLTTLGFVKNPNE